MGKKSNIKINREEFEKLQKQQLQAKFNEFIPSDLAKYIIDSENEKKKKWLYVSEESRFYSYSQDEGYWKNTEDDYLLTTIREYLRKINKKWEKRHHVKEVKAAMKSILLDPQNSKLLDSSGKKNEKYINLKNGMLNIEDGKITDHSYDYYSKFQLPVNYNPEQQYDFWESALNDWVNDENTIRFLQEYIGYCLLPDTSLQIAVILLGDGDNGKSTFLDVISELFGDNVSEVPLEEIPKRFQTKRIKDKLINICSDIESGYLKETGTIKKLIRGETLSGEYKNGKSFGFRPIAKLIFSANKMPRVRDKSHGWYRSFQLVEFPNKFTKGTDKHDRYFKKKLTNNLSGILNWALEGLERLNRNNGFTQSEKVTKQKQIYINENDSIVSFLSDNTTKNADSKVYGTKLYNFYKEYCKSQSLEIQSRKEFTSILKNNGFESKSAHVNTEIGTQKCYHGLEMLDVEM